MRMRAAEPGCPRSTAPTTGALLEGPSTGEVNVQELVWSDAGRGAAGFRDPAGDRPEAGENRRRGTGGAGRGTSYGHGENDGAGRSGDHAGDRRLAADGRSPLPHAR